MAQNDRGCGRLLLVAGIVALAAGMLAWLIGLELRERGVDRTVWSTPSGAHYHLRDCAALSRSTPTEITLAAAQSEGLTPCELCAPPA